MERARGPAVARPVQHRSRVGPSPLGARPRTPPGGRATSQTSTPGGGAGRAAIIAGPSASPYTPPVCARAPRARFVIGLDRPRAPCPRRRAAARGRRRSRPSLRARSRRATRRMPRPAAAPSIASAREALPVDRPGQRERRHIAFFATLRPRRLRRGDLPAAAEGRILTVARDGDSRARGSAACPDSASTRPRPLSDNGTVAFAAAVSGGPGRRGHLRVVGRAPSAPVATTGSPAPGMARRGVLAGLDVPRDQWPAATSSFLATIRRGRESLDANPGQSELARCGRWSPRGTPRRPGGVFAALRPARHQCPVARGGVRRGGRGQGGAGRPSSWRAADPHPDACGRR